MGENGSNGTSLRFDEFELDLAKRRLLRFDETVPLKPKAFDLLAVLVENNGRLLTKDDLFQLVWADQFVDETNLTVGISAIRRALGEKAAEPRYITNVSGRGYYFEADLHTNGRPEQPAIVENAEAAASLPSPGFSWAAVLLGALALAVAAAAGLYFLKTRTVASRAALFEPLSVRRLTTTGRATSTAVSPDGKRYAFTQTEPDGKNTTVWVAQIDGSGLVQVRESVDRAISGVTFSADGERVFYTVFDRGSNGSGTLYRSSVFGGVPEKVHDDVSSRIAVSPDGKSFLFARTVGGLSSLLIANLADGTERPLVSIETTKATFSSSFAFSGDGTQIAAAAVTNERSPGSMEIFTIDSRGGELNQVSNGGFIGIRSLIWSQDSKSFLATVGSSSSDLERQVVQIFPNDGEYRYLLADSNAYTTLSLSSDGSALVASQTQSISNVWVAPASDLAAAKQVTFDMLGKQSGWNSIDWTPDGRIIYSGRIGKSDTIWQMAASGADQKQLLAENGRNEYCSTPNDGSFVVFMSNRTGESEIWRSSPDGTQLKRLTFSGDNESPHVSPDGRSIVYKGGRGAEKRLWLISSDGGEPRQLTRAPSDWARFSPDSKQVACGYDVDGKTKLAVIDLESGDPVKTFDVPETANFRLSVRWMPDGKAVTYRDWQNGIWRQAISGGPPTRLAGLPAEKLFAYAWSRDGKWFAFSRGTSISDAVLLTSLN